MAEKKLILGVIGASTASALFVLLKGKSQPTLSKGNFHNQMKLYKKEKSY